MGWEERERGGLYYTRSRKINGQVVREYIGVGPLAEHAAEMDALERRRREEEADVWRTERERLEALEAPVSKLSETTEMLARITLVAAGYHQHNRGEWRKRRMNPRQKKPTVGSPAKKGRTPKEKVPKTEEDLFKLLRRAERGDETVLPALRETLDRGPELASICGDLAARAERALIGVMSKDNLLMKEAVPRKLKEMRKELAGPSPSSLEKLLVERVVACWLALQHAELLVAQRSFGNVSVQQVEYYQRRLDRSHRRYLSAVRTLAQIRKLGPAVQINIAEQQVNVAR